MPYFDEPLGWVKIQTTSKNTQRYYTKKRLIRDLLSNTPNYCLCGRVSRTFIYKECVTEICVAERNWRGNYRLKLICQRQENKAYWFLWFWPRNHWRNLFHFLWREKNRLSIVKITHQFKVFTLRFLSRQNVENKFVWTNIFFFVTSFQFVACALRENLSNRFSGVQIPRDICTHLGRYLYSTKCS